MLALYRAGRQSEALAAYRDARTRSSSRSASSQAPSCGRCTKRARPGSGARPPRSAGRARRRRRGRRRAGARALLVAAAAVLLAGIARVRPHPRARARRPARHRRGRGRASSTRTALASPPSTAVGRAPSAVAAGGGSVWVANRLDGTVSRIDRPHEPVVTIHGRRRARRRSRSAAARCGSPTATAATSPRSIPGPTRSCSGSRPATRRARWRWRRARSGSPPAPTAACAGSTSTAPRRTADPPRREPDRYRRRRRSDLGGERGGRDRHPHRSALAAPSRPRSMSATGRAPWRSARARCGSSTAMTARCRGSTRARTRCGDASRVGGDPTGGRGGRGAVWVAGGEEGTVARVDPAGRA